MAIKKRRASSIAPVKAKRLDLNWVNPSFQKEEFLNLKSSFARDLSSVVSGVNREVDSLMAGAHLLKFNTRIDETIKYIYYKNTKHEDGAIKYGRSHNYCVVSIGNA